MTDRAPSPATGLITGVTGAAGDLGGMIYLLIRLPAAGSPMKSLALHLPGPSDSLTKACAFQIARYIRRPRLMMGYKLDGGSSEEVKYLISIEGDVIEVGRYI